MLLAPGGACTSGSRCTGKITWAGGGLEGLAGKGSADVVGIVVGMGGKM